MQCVSVKIRDKSNTDYDRRRNNDDKVIFERKRERERERERKKCEQGIEGKKEEREVRRGNTKIK